jgi:hypothetical protein
LPANDARVDLAASFVRTTPAQEDTLNVDQERVYVWMRYMGGS